MDARDIQEAVQLFLLEDPLVESELARAVVQFNWDRGVTELEDSICIEQYANAHADAD